MTPKGEITWMRKKQRTKNHRRFKMGKIDYEKRARDLLNNPKTESILEGLYLEGDRNALGELEEIFFNMGNCFGSNYLWNLCYHLGESLRIAKTYYPSLYDDKTQLDGKSKAEEIIKRSANEG